MKSLVLILALLGCVTVMAGDLKPINNEELQQLENQQAVVVDIRTPEEWKASGIIPGSHPLTFFDTEGRFDLPAFANTLNRLSPDISRPIVLVCRSGHRSEEAGKMLATLWPNRKVLHLDHGITGWVRDGRPVSPMDRLP
jgi:rhodanese-related sulfurtransferase